MADSKKRLPTSTAGEVERFLQQVRATTPRRQGGTQGRLIFALDATASREPTWDRAAQIQGEMFHETAALGGLAVQLVYYRGFLEFDASPWVNDAEGLLGRMTAVRCLAGQTQIGRVLEHAREETRRRRVNALVFVGDSMEEDPDRLFALAGQLGVLGLPVFLFHEGHDPLAATTFREIARLSGGACCPFDAGSARQLLDLLAAVAVFAAGGRAALEDFGQRRGGVVARLTHQMGKR